MAFFSAAAPPISFVAPRPTNRRRRMTPVRATLSGGTGCCESPQRLGSRRSQYGRRRSASGGSCPFRRPAQTAKPDPTATFVSITRNDPKLTRSPIRNLQIDGLPDLWKLRGASLASGARRDFVLAMSAYLGICLYNRWLGHTGQRLRAQNPASRKGALQL